MFIRSLLLNLPIVFLLEVPLLVTFRIDEALLSSNQAPILLVLRFSGLILDVLLNGTQSFPDEWATTKVMVVRTQELLL